MRKLRIAVISTPFIRVPPEGYGGTELFCANLVRELVCLGHDVTLFATGDSQAPCTVEALFARAVWPPASSIEMRHLSWAISRVARSRTPFDIIQLNSALGLSAARAIGIPAVCTLHMAAAPELSALYRAEQKWAHFVGISARQIELETALRSVTVIHHGLDPEAYPPSLGRGRYLAHVGRFAPEKGTHVAIDAARRVGLPIRLAGRCHDVDRAYYERELLPRVADTSNGEVDLVGEANHAKKVALLAGARAVLCPIAWEEPFGLVAVEAMLCGTPVVGFRRGSFPEIVDQEVTGMLVDEGDFDGLCRAIERITSLDRGRCAERARQRFSAHAMARAYERLFLSIVEDRQTERRRAGEPLVRSL